MMKKVFIIAAFAGLMSCNDESKPIIMGTQYDFTQDGGVSDSTDIFGPFLPGEIDSLTTVTELLEHLETLPSNEELPE